MKWSGCRRLNIAKGCQVGEKLVYLLLVLLLFGVVVAESPAAVGGDIEKATEDAEKAKELIDKYGLGDDGKIDYGKYRPFVTKAELRIATINLWLDENVGWMRYIFHMKPAVSFLFFINVYVILWFFVVLFLNAKGLWFFIEEEGKSRIFGFGVFFILLVIRLYYGLANVLYGWLTYIWFILTDFGVWLGIIFVFLCFVFAPFSISAIGSIMLMLARYKASMEARRQKVEMDTNIEAVDELIGQIKDKN